MSIGRINLILGTTLMLACSLLCVTSSLPTCPSFWQIHDEGATSFNCDNRTCFDFRDSYGRVVGTKFYNEFTPVCLAALHAGVIDQDGGEVHFQRLGRMKTFNGSTRNRVVSNSWNIASIGAYSFTSEVKHNTRGYDSDSWASEVYIVHNSGLGDKPNHFWGTCLRDGTTPRMENAFDYLFRKLSNECYDLQTDEQGKKVTLYKNITAENGFRFNRIIRCIGNHSSFDVTAVIRNPKDNFLTNATFTVNPMDDILRFQLSAVPDGVNWIRLQEVRPWARLSERFSINSTFVEIPVAEVNKVTSMYEVTQFNNRTNYRGIVCAESSYLRIIVLECPEGQYGAPNCIKCPRNCYNNGVCHPVTGGCICRPGFNGTQCEKACSSDHFGSKCHLKCDRADLGRHLRQGEIDADDILSCRGLTFCLPDPYGCSCSAGYGGDFCEEIAVTVEKAKRNETRRDETRRNETRNETKRNETKRVSMESIPDDSSISMSEHRCIPDVAWTVVITLLSMSFTLII